MPYLKLWKSKRWFWIDMILSTALVAGFVQWSRKHPL